MIWRLVRILVITIFISNVGFAQNEANIWYFGENAGLDFNSGAPVPLLDGALDTLEGCASISDTSGNLLFYTDGSTVYNNNHLVMFNGTGLNGDKSSTHSAIVVPKPNNSDVYYIFTVDNNAEASGLQYSEVDMTLDGGLGGVTPNKNIILTTPTSEKITAIKSSTANEYWVISHKWNSSEFIAYQVTDSGINTTPISTIIDPVIGGFEENAIGQIKISPDGTKLAMAIEGNINQAWLFDFNASTGLVSNSLLLLDDTNITSVYGIEFSPNSKVLYVGGAGNHVFQYNLQAGNTTNIINSRLQLTTIQRPYGALQLATDGKIYIAKSNQFYIDVIDNPNIIGLGCNYQFEHLYLGGQRSKFGLPPFIQTFLLIDNIQFENVCFGDTTSFLLTDTVDSATWDFDDPASGVNNTSTDIAPTHVFSAYGTYEVSVNVIIGTQSASSTTTVTIYEQPTATQPQDILICDDNNDGFYNFDLTTQDSDILNGQSASVFNLTYFASMMDYNNDNPITDPNNYVNTTAYTSQAIVASIRNINNTDCEDTITFYIEVFESPTPSINIPSLSFCDNTSVGTNTDGIIEFDLTQNESAILNGQSATDFTVSYFTDLTLTNQINDPSAYQNTNATETIYVEVVNNDNTNCTAQTSFDVEVFELPTVTTVVTLRQCDDNLDGFSVFNLTEANAEITTNHLNETITYYETQLDAENDSNAITNNTSYTNQTVSTDIIWARVENDEGCYAVSQINLIISTTQIPNTFIRDFYQCDDGLDTADGLATFDFSSVNIEIEALFPVGQQLEINYYRNLSDALSETNAIVDITNYENIGYPNSQDIYIRVDSALDNDCLGLGHHITLHVEPLPLVTGPVIIEQCDFGNDGSEFFDTSGIEDELSIGQTETITFSYEDEFGNPLPSPLPNPMEVTMPIFNIFATMTATNSNQGCSVQASIALIISNSVTINPVDAFIACDDNQDGLYTFNTSTLEIDLFGSSEPDTEISYTDGNGNSIPSPFPNTYTTGNQNITASISSTLNLDCYDTFNVEFIVYAQPVANTILDDYVCDTDNDGEHTFILLTYNSQILNGQSPSTFEVHYFEDEADALSNSNVLPNSYVTNSVSKTLFAKIQNKNNPNCYDITSFEVGVNNIPTAHQPENINLCDNGNDDVETIGLTIQDEFILNGQSAAENIISYYLSIEDAESGTNLQPNNFTNTTNPQTIYTRVENINSSECYSITSFKIVLYEQPELLMDDLWPICEGSTVDIFADQGYDYYNWSSGQTSRGITVDESGLYTVTVSNVYGNLICSTEKTVSVSISNSAIITDIETVDWSQSNNSISVFVEGNGDYEYSIDGVNYQDDSIFSSLIADEYTVYVRDKNGCGIVSENIYLLYYPRFFTPNGDGNNDFWQIKNSAKEQLNQLSIYNRYGKLIIQLKPSDFGWDGTLNGSKLPSSDYWFVLERQNGKTYTGHFSLKR